MGIFPFDTILDGRANGERSSAGAGVDSAREQEKLKATKNA